MASKLSDGSRAGLLNDMVMLPEAEDTILITETSSTYQRRDIFFEVLEMGGNGRLLAYHPSNGTFEPLLSQLHFPNGICLHADGDSVLFNELTLFRVMRYKPTTSAARAPSYSFIFQVLSPWTKEEPSRGVCGEPSRHTRQHTKDSSHK